MLHNCLKKEWWIEKLRNIFPEDCGSYNPAWDLNLSFDQILHTHWYKNGPFLFGINYQETGHTPKILIRVLDRPDLNVDRTFDLNIAEEETTFIEALANQNSALLCLHLPWAVPIIEYGLKTAAL